MGVVGITLWGSVGFGNLMAISLYRADEICIYVNGGNVDIVVRFELFF